MCACISCFVFVLVMVRAWGVLGFEGNWKQCLATFFIIPVFRLWMGIMYDRGCVD